MKNAWAAALLLAFCVLSAGCAEQRTSHLEGAYRSLKMLEGATGVGVSYGRYGELLQTASGEVLIARQRATSSTAREAVGRYARALQHYLDAYTLWSEKVEDAQYSFIPKGKILVSGKVQAVVNSQGLAIEEKRLSTDTFSFVSEDAIQLLWSRAGGEIARGDSMYLATVR